MIAGLLPWLRYRDTEIANGARTMAYLRNGLAGARSGVFDNSPRFPCDVLYRMAGVTGPGDFDTPATDPAPWYDPAFPESAGFLGYVPVPESVEGLDSGVIRSSSARIGGIGGARLGVERQAPRTVAIKTGYLFAASSAAAEYGLRWLTETLAASNCDSCQKGALEIYVACPSPDDGSADSVGHYTLYDVGLVTGPRHLSTAVPDESCDIREIELTLLAENPYLYRDTVECLPAEIVGAAAVCDDPLTFFLGERGAPHCCDITAPLSGTLGSIITITSPDGVGGLECGWFARHGTGIAACPPLPADTPDRVIYVEKLAGGQQLVIDSARRRVTLIEDGESDGVQALHLVEGRAIDWLEVAECDGDGCICVRTTSPCSEGAATTVQIQTQLRFK